MGHSRGLHTAAHLSDADRKRLEAAQKGDPVWMQYLQVIIPIVLVILLPALTIYVTVRYPDAWDVVMVQLHRLFAWQGDVDSKFRIATLHYHGSSGVEQSIPLALEKYKEAADQGHTASQRILGFLSYKGQSGIEQDFVTAAKWFKLAAEGGDPHAQSQYGYMVHKGLGVESNHEEAIQWYLRAAEKGDAKAMYNMAIHYINGHGVERDDIEAVKWFILAEAREPDIDKDGNRQRVEGLLDGEQRAEVQRRVRAYAVGD